MEYQEKEAEKSASGKHIELVFDWIFSEVLQTCSLQDPVAPSGISRCRNVCHGSCGGDDAVDEVVGFAVQDIRTVIGNDLLAGSSDVAEVCEKDRELRLRCIVFEDKFFC